MYGKLLSKVLVSTLITSSMDATSKLSLVDKIQLDVFGDWKSAKSSFPNPMPKEEAGPSLSGQRRYLWTDSFGIVNFVSQAKLVNTSVVTKQMDSDRKEYLNAASMLIDSVYECLGAPRSAKHPMTPDAERGGFKGLRIGKTLARVGNSDMGMTYDGMYWHYIVQFIFAVTRYVQESGDRSALNKVIGLVKQVHPALYVPEKGYRWKINSDLTPIVQRDPYPNHDAVSALVVYNIVNNMSEDKQALNQEIADLMPIARKYYDQNVQELITDVMDPLGLGLQLWSSQFVEGYKPHLFRDQLLTIARPLMQHFLSDSESGRESDLNFRLYGSLFGMQLYDADLSQYAESVVRRFVDVEMKREVGDSPHSTINKVMFATTVNPLAYKRTEADGVVMIGPNTSDSDFSGLP